MAQLRNPQLYRRLCQVFGRRNVRVHRPGEAGSFAVQKITGPNARQQFRRMGSEVGEQYSVCCPICNDYQPRLHINHLWGTEDPISKKRLLWACHCFNEECQADYQSRLKLAELIFDGKSEVLRVDKTVAVEPVRGPVRLPGAVQDLLTLARNDMRHQAVQWCFARGYSVEELSRHYQVFFCRDGYFAGHRESRLVVPWYDDSPSGVKELAGWTARRMDEQAKSPKWIHGPAPTGRVLYGLPTARMYQTMVLTEGPGDRWAVGPQAFSVLGKTVTDAKADTLRQAIEGSVRRTVIVLLDPKQDKVASARKRKHHSVAAAEVLRKHLDADVFPVYLPIWSDPGGLHRDYIWAYIEREAKAAGVFVSRERIGGGIPTTQ